MQMYDDYDYMDGITPHIFNFLSLSVSLKHATFGGAVEVSIKALWEMERSAILPFGRICVVVVFVVVV